MPSQANHVVHLALGGCLRPPPVSYGISEDTGGHIAYILGAAQGQVDLAPNTEVTIVTRAFDAPELGREYNMPRQQIAPRIALQRLHSERSTYLSKDDLVDELPSLQRAFLAWLGALPRKPDIIHAHFGDAAALAIAAQQTFGIPFIYTPHSLAADKCKCMGATGGRIDQRLARERNAIEQATAIIVSSQDERSNQIAIYDESAVARTQVISPGVDMDVNCGTRLARALVEPALADPDKPMVLGVARPVAKKNLAMLVRAFASSPQLMELANLVILAGQQDSDPGNDVRAELVRLKSQFGLDGRFALPDNHAPDVVPQLYALAAQTGGAFANPALHEPFGLTVLEAARFGLPVVSTCHGGPRDIAKRLKGVALVEPTDESEVAHALERALFDPASRVKASSANLQGVKHYTWAGWASATFDVYEHAIAQRPGARHTHLLASDMDDTLTGCDAGVTRFRRWLERDRPAGLAFCIATGRQFADARTIARGWNLPQPDVWITSVGSEIYHRDGDGGWRRDAGFDTHIAQGFDRAAILALLETCGTELQPPICQRDFKLSLFGTALDAARIRRLLKAGGHEVRVIASHGAFIDVLPMRAGKNAAVAFVAAQLGVQSSAVICAGNSDNDRCMLEGSANAIVVANALDELRDLKPAGRVWRSSERFADGVLEGVRAHLGTQRHDERTTHVEAKV